METGIKSLNGRKISIFLEQIPLQSQNKRCLVLLRGCASDHYLSQVLNEPVLRSTAKQKSSIKYRFSAKNVTTLKGKDIHALCSDEKYQLQMAISG